jgi:hypothetical protein
MLKSKNEATMLLKKKDRPWVRFQNEPILRSTDAVLGALWPAWTFLAVRVESGAR